MKSRQFLPALRGRFGDWAYYSVLMTLNQVAEKVRYAHEIHQTDEHDKLSSLIQRELKDGRSNEISDYLRKNADRFFNSLVIAVYGGDPEWHPFDVKPASPEVRAEDLSNTAVYSIGYLSLSGHENLFALDGQHRVAGIRHVLEHNELGDEEVSVLIVAHHNDAKGLRRTRKLFTTLNRTAKPVKKSEIIALDESDVMAICTRHLVENHRYFNGDQVDVLNKQANLHQTNYTSFTTIINLYDILQIVFSQTKDRLDHTERDELRFVRPSDKKVLEYTKFSEEYFEALATTFPALKDYFESDNQPDVLRRMRSPTNSHILFRPVGLKIFAEVIAKLRETLSFKDSIRLVKKLPTRMQSAPYEHVVWVPHRQTIEIRQAPLCRDLLLYMVGHCRDKTQLRERYAKAQDRDVSEVRLPNVVA